MGLLPLMEYCNTSSGMLWIVIYLLKTYFENEKKKKLKKIG
jgi:hypothetical protein